MIPELARNIQRFLIRPARGRHESVNDEITSRGLSPLRGKTKLGMMLSFKLARWEEN